MAKLCPLFSSSSGNSIYISSSDGAILVDAGMSAKQIDNELELIGASADKIRGILVTHEHSDHIRGLRVFCSKHKIPVFASAGTLDGIIKYDNFSGIELNEISFDGFELAEMKVLPFHTPHDSRESNGYKVITADNRTIAVATDLGNVTDEVRGTLLGCDAVLLESNHDIGMLQNGPYPYILKRRILSDTGHLSNDNCALLSSLLVMNGTTRIVLGHLSRENNVPSLALQTTKSELDSAGAQEGKDYILKVAKPVNDEKAMII